MPLQNKEHTAFACKRGSNHDDCRNGSEDDLRWSYNSIFATEGGSTIRIGIKCVRGFWEGLAWGRVALLIWFYLCFSITLLFILCLLLYVENYSMISLLFQCEYQVLSVWFSYKVDFVFLDARYFFTLKYLENWNNSKIVHTGASRESKYLYFYSVLGIAFNT